MNHRHTAQTLSAAGELRVRPPQHFQAPALFPGTPLSAVFCAVFGPYPRRAGLCVGTRLAFRSLLLPSEHVLLPQHHRNGPALTHTRRTGFASLAPPTSPTQVRSPAHKTPGGNWHLLCLQSFRNSLIFWLFIFAIQMGDSVSNKNEALQAQMK